MTEVWKTIPGYEGLYEVSSLGRIKSLKRNGTPERIRVGKEDINGYPQLSLTINRKLKTFRIHKLVQLGFDLGEGMVDHINRDRTDNRLENLRVVTARENALNSANNNELPGAYYFPRNTKKPWMSKITIEGEEVYLGYFETKEDASAAYMEKKASLA
jgi:hypothetical protein